MTPHGAGSTSRGSTSGDVAVEASSWQLSERVSFEPAELPIRVSGSLRRPVRGDRSPTLAGLVSDYRYPHHVVAGDVVLVTADGRRVLSRLVGGQPKRTVVPLLVSRAGIGGQHVRADRKMGSGLIQPLECGHRGALLPPLRARQS